MNTVANVLPILFIILIVGIFVFLICRELLCWYWKINRTIELLESIDKKLGPASAEKVAEKTGSPDEAAILNKYGITFDAAAGLYRVAGKGFNRLDNAIEEAKKAAMNGRLA